MFSFFIIYLMLIYSMVIWECWRSCTSLIERLAYLLVFRPFSLQVNKPFWWINTSFNRIIYVSHRNKINIKNLCSSSLTMWRNIVPWNFVMSIMFLQLLIQYLFTLTILMFLLNNYIYFYFYPNLIILLFTS